MSIRPLAPIDAARIRAEKIRRLAREVLEWRNAITTAWEKRDWETLGYENWDAYVSGEFNTAAKLRMSTDERREMVAALRGASGGMSTRAIASALGTSKSAVARDLQSGVPDGTPDAPRVESDEVIEAEIVEDWPDVTVEESTEPMPSMKEHFAKHIAEAHTPAEPKTITGTDGKTYTVPRPADRPRRRRALTDVARDRGFELRKAMEAVDRVFDDDRYRDNSDQICTLLRGHLQYVQETAAAYLDQMPAREGDQP